MEKPERIGLTCLWVHREMRLALHQSVDQTSTVPIGGVISISRCYLNNGCAWERESERKRDGNINTEQYTALIQLTLSGRLLYRLTQSPCVSHLPSFFFPFSNRIRMHYSEQIISKQVQIQIQIEDKYR